MIVCSWIAEEWKKKVLNKLANCTPPECQSKQSGTHLTSECVFSSAMWPQLARGVKRRSQGDKARERCFCVSCNFSLVIDNLEQV